MNEALAAIPAPYGPYGGISKYDTNTLTHSPANAAITLTWFFPTPAKKLKMTIAAPNAMMPGHIVRRIPLTDENSLPKTSPNTPDGNRSTDERDPEGDEKTEFC